MKIIFERNDRLQEQDKKIYENSISELRDLSDKKIFLLKDDRTFFKAFKPGNPEDIKSVYLLIKSETGKFKIKMKGNLSFNDWEERLKFYPVFMDKFNSFSENEKFHYEVDLSEVNKQWYINLLNEFKKDKYTPANATVEWKGFIEPYEYYVDLKFQLLKQDFMMLQNFERELSKVIVLDSKNPQFKNYLENELYLEKIEDNRRRMIFLDFYTHKGSFKNDFLKNNTFNIAKSIEIFDKDQMNTAIERASTLNFKFKTILGKSTFFTTDSIYTSEDLKKDGRMSKEDIELETEHAYVSDLIEEYSVIDTRSSRIKNIINSIEEVNIKENFDSTEFKNLISKIKNVNSSFVDAEKAFSSISKEFNSKIKMIEDDAMSYVNDVMFEIGRFERVSLINELNYLNSELSNYNEKIEDHEIEFKNYRDNTLSSFKNKVSELDSDDEEYEVNFLKLQEWRENEINKIESKFNKDIDDLNERYFKEIKSYIKSNINNKISIMSESISSILKTIQSGVARTVSFRQETNIVFNFKNKDDKRILNNFYVLNTGDMVLVDTIRRINTKIKKGEEMNSDILYKIIRKEKMTLFNDAISPGVKEFIPDEYAKLNPSQQKAFRLAIDKTDPISIIQGPPGTGKTEVITNIIKYYRNKGEKVILSSQTNVALKNVLDKLCSEDKIENSVIIPWLTTKSKEIYSKTNLDKTWYDKVIKNIYKSDMSFMSKWDAKLNELTEDTEILKDLSLIRDIKVYAATTTTSVTLPGRGYDQHLKDVKVLIIDEVSKSILPEILRYALDVEKVILVGDYKQLNPIFDIRQENFDVAIDKDRFKMLKKEIESGIFYRLAEDAKKVDRIASLDVNYRSVPGVLDAYNIFYNEAGKQEGLTGFRKFEEFSNNYKFRKSDNFDSKHSFYFFDVQGAKEEKRGTSRYNRGEVKVLINALWEVANTLDNANEKEVAIIFPYAAQINLFTNEINKPINKPLRDMFKDLQWDTVDSFQGSEADIVFLSTVVTDANTNNFLSDFRRINVSMSRAKDMLVVFGNSFALKAIEVGGEGITPGKYFAKILDQKENEYLKVVKIKETGD